VRGKAFRIPDACVARGWRFEVELTTPKQRSAVAQHFGARRFAYSWALAQVKGNLDARTADTTIPVLAWNLPAIRREWNQVKHQAAPWWRECSKEAYACGIADLVAALHHWYEAKHGRRGGRRIGFPANAKLAALDRRAANLRREAVHTLTTRLARRYGTIVVEDLDVAAMARGMGRRAFRSSVHQAAIGRVRPTLAYKTSWAGGRLLVPTAGSLLLGPITVAAATAPISPSPIACGYAPGVRSWWTATPTRPLISVTGPDQSMTGTSSGMELPPRWRSWVTTAGRRTQPRGRARPRKTTARWRGPVTPEPTPILRARDPEQGYQERSDANAH
jgi:IS605 OrfB family transposase